MTLKVNIGEWGRLSANKTEPSASEIANGVPAGSVADSGWYNYHTGHQDRDIAHAMNAAQDASQFANRGSDDRFRLCSRLHSAPGYNWVLPYGGGRTWVQITTFYDMCTAWNFDRNEACVITTGSGTDGLYRVNTWDTENLSEEFLDIDETDFNGAYSLCSDGTYLYMAYKHASTVTWHIAKLSLETWTGLFEEDRDTGITVTGTSLLTRVCMADETHVGFFYGNGSTITYGIWATDDTSFVIGSGNASSVASANVTAAAMSNLVSNGNHLFAAVQDSSGDYWLTAASISDPTTATNPSSIPLSFGSDFIYPSLAIVGGSIVVTSNNGTLIQYDPEGAWYPRNRYTETLTSLTVNTNRSLCVAGTSLWQIMAVENTVPMSDTYEHLCFRFSASDFVAQNVEVPAQYNEVIPLGYAWTSPPVLTPRYIQSCWDGRRLIISEPGVLNGGLNGFLAIVTR